MNLLGILVNANKYFPLYEWNGRMWVGVSNVLVRVRTIALE
jgi:hypothetical protein